MNSLKLGKTIKAFRILRAIPAKEMADYLSICEKQYYNLENGETKLDVERLSQIALKLKVKPETILHFNLDEWTR